MTGKARRNKSPLTSAGVRRAAIAATIIGAGLIAGCALQDRLDDDQLVTSGFRKIKLTSPEWVAAAKALPPHKFTRRSVDGKPVILYSDPIACGCVYMASPAVYADYRAVRAAEIRSMEDASVQADVE